jgi:lysine 6-dehydrogenase
VRTVVVLGAGLVGRVIARDLASDPGLSVLAVDRSSQALGSLAGPPRITVRQADLADPRTVAAIAREADAVAVAVPGFLGERVLREVLEAGRPVCDISFAPGDPLALDGLARERGVSAVVDCGVAPGLSNVLVGRGAAELARLESAEIFVGGLPFRRTWPYEYRIVFSATDVIEEYTRPSRFREHGVEVVRPALSEVELLDFPVVGTLEAFNTDGLRTLLRTIDAPNLKEKTLRYPGHADRMRMLRDTGYFSVEPVDLGHGVRVPPRALTERLLFAAWTRPEDEEEFTLLRVAVTGEAQGGRRVCIAWDLFDRTDLATATTSMARTTGFPCAIVVRMLLDGAWSVPGVHPPERLGADPAACAAVLDGLARRGVRVIRSSRAL